MTEVIDDEELARIVEEIRDSLYDDYEIKSKLELDLIVKQLQKQIDRDHRLTMQQQNRKSTVSTNEDYIK